ncbi:hypothetical protein MUB16_02980 [Priestia sp. OVL9]|nr:hypothetical protein [Priestia sp. OVL9]
MKQLIINNVEFNIENFEEKTITHSTTGEQLKKIGFAFSVIGKKIITYMTYFSRAPILNLLLLIQMRNLK